jgi:NADPH:quinone reductase-like Zn-dependent oxidoreductase
MKAIRLHVDDEPSLVFEEVPVPRPGRGEVLVRVLATGVTRAELGWSTTWQTPGGGKRMHAIPGHDLAGIVAEVGVDVPPAFVGTPVYALTDFARDGAEAEYAIATTSEVAPKPSTLDYVEAAAVPLAALTAWQGLFDHGKLTAGQTVLIHGAAGGVGVFAVQLAHRAGARVVATASAANRDLVAALGADEIIDHTRVRFDQALAPDIDLVFDAVGGDTLDQSWAVLKRGGMLLSVVEKPSAARAARQGVRSGFFIVRPDREQLLRIGSLIDAGELRPVVEKVLALSEATQAYEGDHTHGKIVLSVGR